MKKEDVLNLIQESFDSLFDADMIKDRVEVSDNTVLLGSGSPLDSISFITLFSEIEDRISDLSGAEFYLVLSEIHEFNADDNVLNVSVLIDFICQKN